MTFSLVASVYAISILIMLTLSFPLDYLLPGYYSLDVSDIKEITTTSQNIFYRWNEHYRVVEAVDVLSGEVLAIQQDFHEEHILNPEKMLKVTLDGKEMLIQKGMTVSAYTAPKLNYSRPVADIVLQRVSEGMTLKKACIGLSVTPAMIYNWCEKIPSFGEALNKAKLVRAEMVHDTILETAEDLSTGNLTKGELEGKVRAAELLKWSAEKDSPTRFGSRKDTAGNGATVIQIITGVTRDESITVEVKNDKESP